MNMNRATLCVALDNESKPVLIPCWARTRGYAYDLTAIWNGVNKWRGKYKNGDSVVTHVSAPTGTRTGYSSYEVKYYFSTSDIHWSEVPNGYTLVCPTECTFENGHAYGYVLHRDGSKTVFDTRDGQYEHLPVPIFPANDNGWKIAIARKISAMVGQDTTQLEWHYDANGATVAVVPKTFHYMKEDPHEKVTFSWIVNEKNPETGYLLSDEYYGQGILILKTIEEAAHEIEKYMRRYEQCVEERETFLKVTQIPEGLYMPYPYNLRGHVIMTGFSLVESKKVRTGFYNTADTETHETYKVEGVHMDGTPSTLLVKVVLNNNTIVYHHITDNVMSY